MSIGEKVGLLCLFVSVWATQGEDIDSRWWIVAGIFFILGGFLLLNV